MKIDDLVTSDVGFKAASSDLPVLRELKFSWKNPPLWRPENSLVVSEHQYSDGHESGESLFTRLDKPMNSYVKSLCTKYFGKKGKSFLRHSLLVRFAYPSDQEELAAKDSLIDVALRPVIAAQTSQLLENQIKVTKNHGEWEFVLLTLIGKAVWNIIESTVVLNKLPMDGVQPVLGAQLLLERGLTEEQIIKRFKIFLDRWNEEFTMRNRSRRGGLHSDAVCPYRSMPIWKAEGFADVVATALKLRAGTGLLPTEKAAWSHLSKTARVLVEEVIRELLPVNQRE